MPARSLLLVHGAGSGPWVFDEWLGAFPGLEVEAVDLQQGFDAASASMADYAANVERHGQRLPKPLALCGWSMGGLVVLLAAQRLRPHSVILIEASAPGEVQGFAPEAQLSDGVFDPEEVFGPFPNGMRARPESQRARDERKRGLSVPSLPCPSLVIWGWEYARERGKPIAELYGSDEAFFPELDHWQLVLDERVRREVARFLGIGT